MGLGEKYRKALRSLAKKDLEPMTKTIFKYHLEKIRRKENARKHNQNK